MPFEQLTFSRICPPSYLQHSQENSMYTISKMSDLYIVYLLSFDIVYFYIILI